MILISSPISFARTSPIPKLLKNLDAHDYHSLTHIDVCCRSATPDCGGVIKEDCILTKSQAHISLERPILEKVVFVKREMLQE